MPHPGEKELVGVAGPSERSTGLLALDIRLPITAAGSGNSMARVVTEEVADSAAIDFRQRTLKLVK